MTSGNVAVFSPVALTPEVKQTVDAMGALKYIVALDAEHHIFLGPWHEAFPNAKVLGPEGLPEKRAKQKNEDVPFAVVFKGDTKESAKVDAEFDRDFEYEYVDSHVNKELVFNYKPERTLIEADYLFNLPATEQFSKTTGGPGGGILDKIFHWLGHTRGAAMGQKRFVWWLGSSANRPSFNKSTARIATFDFDRIIPCHGDVIETNGRGIFNTVFDWHLQAAKKGQ